MPRNALLLGAFAVSLAIFVAPAAADTARDCEQANDQDPRIRGCSLIIEGKVDGNKAMAYYNRGLAFRAKGEQERAAADFIRAKEAGAK